MNTSYPIRVVPAELSESVKLLADGRYLQSLAVLNRLRNGVPPKSCDSWSGWALLVAAKDKFHLEDDRGATECLLAVPRELLNQSPDLSAQYYLLDGLIRKRCAYRAWKSEQPHTARNGVAQAIESFRLAQSVAFGDNQQLLRLNARLNQFYAEGLAAAIARQSHVANPQLVVETIRTEAEIRKWSAPKLRNDLAGFVIIADLARAANMTITDAASIDPSAEGREGSADVFGTSQSDWPTSLIDLTRLNGSRPSVIAQGLVLGAMMMLKPRYQHLQSTLAYPYQVRLLHVLLSLQKEVQRETTLTGQVRDAIRRIENVAGTRFRGLRVLR